MGSRQPRAKALSDSLGGLLRAHYDGLAQEPLPERWIELINCLDERERLRMKSELCVDAGEDAARPLRN
jgi:hypothetical protein